MAKHCVSLPGFQNLPLVLDPRLGLSVPAEPEPERELSSTETAEVLFRLASSVRYTLRSTPLSCATLCGGSSLLRYAQ